MPHAAPMMALSLIGVSITRSQPKRSSNPSLVLNAPPYTPTSSPSSTTAGSRSISSKIACLMASRKVTGSPWVTDPFADNFLFSAMAYLRAFPAEALADFLKLGLALDFAGALLSYFAAVLPEDFAAPFVTTFAGFFGASLASLSANSSAGGVSPKWIGAFFPPELFPSPKPATFQTAATLERGGVTSALLRSH